MSCTFVFMHVLSDVSIILLPLTLAPFVSALFNFTFPQPAPLSIFFQFSNFPSLVSRSAVSAYFWFWFFVIRHVSLMTTSTVFVNLFYSSLKSLSSKLICTWVFLLTLNHEIWVLWEFSEPKMWLCFCCSKWLWRHFFNTHAILLTVDDCRINKGACLI